jgi:hypothetical protein
MVAIDSLWLCSIETTELLDLSGYDVFERTDQARMKDYPRHGVPQQVCGKVALACLNSRWTRRGRKRCRQVEVEASVDSRFSGYRRCPLRILHENHRTYGRHRSAPDALKGSLSGLLIPSPVVGVDDEKTT